MPKLEKRDSSKFWWSRTWHQLILPWQETGSLLSVTLGNFDVSGSPLVNLRNGDDYKK